MNFRNYPHQFLHVPAPGRLPRPRVADEVILLTRRHLAVAAERARSAASSLIAEDELASLSGWPRIELAHGHWIDIAQPPA